MKYNTPPKDLFIQNRHAFSAEMKPNTMGIFYSSALTATNADAHYKFEQNSNMYYLSGIDQEDVILMLFPDAPKEQWKEILFVKKTNKEIQIWEGWKYSIEEAREASGIQTVRYLDEFERFFRMLISHCDGIYLDFNEHERNALVTRTPSHLMADRLQREYPAHRIERAAPMLEGLRAVKSEWEVSQIREACNITAKAFDRVLHFVKPGVWEYEIEAEIMHEFLRNRSRGPAYEPIIASGKNACVLHYIQNDAQCKDGELILFDFGAEYGNYSSDLSRTIPVNGRFTDRQKAVYNAVLRVFKAAKEMLRPGNYLEEYHEEVGKLMEKELVDLGLISMDDIKKQNPEWPAYKKYFMHGTSHFMGLDTHDVGNRYKAFEEGNVFTCEPGIYILEEGIGIRIENDILITNSGPVDLMENIPIEADHIEEIMQAKKELV